MPGKAETLHATECRQCCTFCDRVVLPAGCIENACPYLFLYDDESSGNRYMGCMNRVFAAEINVALFEEAQRTRLGYGGVKMTGDPITRCRIGVEKAYQGVGEAFSCVNPRFFDDPEGEGAAVGFDLRDGL